MQLTLKTALFPCALPKLGDISTGIQSSNKEMELIEEKERSSHLYDQLLDARNELANKTSDLQRLSMQNRRGQVRRLAALRSLCTLTSGSGNDVCAADHECSGNECSV